MASTFAASLTDIGELMTKDTFVALQMPLEVHLQIFAITGLTFNVGKLFETSIVAGIQIAIKLVEGHLVGPALSTSRAGMPEVGIPCCDVGLHKVLLDRCSTLRERE